MTYIPKRPLMIPFWKIWIASIGRIIDALVWLFTAGHFKTTFHQKVVFFGEPEMSDLPLVKSTPRVDHAIYMKTDGTALTATNEYGIWIHLIQAFLLFVDGFIGFISLGLVEHSLASDFETSKIWIDYAKAGYRITI